MKMPTKKTTRGGIMMFIDEKAISAVMIKGTAKIDAKAPTKIGRECLSVVIWNHP
jgi:hypothetical protein